MIRAERCNRFPTTGSLESNRMPYSAPFQRQLASRTTQGIAVITATISSLLRSAFLVDRRAYTDRERAFNTIYLGGDVPRPYERAVMRKALTYDSFHRHARDFGDSPPRPRRCPHPDWESSFDDSRCDAAAVKSIDVHCRGAHCACICLSIATRALRLIPRHAWRTERNRGFFARIRAHPRAPPAFIKRPGTPTFTPLTAQQANPEGSWLSLKRFYTNFGKRVGKGLLQAHREEAQSRQMSRSRRID